MSANKTSAGLRSSPFERAGCLESGVPLIDSTDSCTEATAGPKEFPVTSRACMQANNSGVATTAAVLSPVRAGARPSKFANVPKAMRRWLRRQHKQEQASRTPCGARRRRDGQPCEALSVPGKKRCKWHGGMSTGPRTPEGKAKVAAHLPRRHKQEQMA
jgi:hypothetical protein